MAGYSTTPLSKKLGLKAGLVVHLINAPDHYAELIGDGMGELIVQKALAQLDFIHLFTNSRKELEGSLPRLAAGIKKSGIIWISWYKKSSGKATELSENLIRNIALSNGLVDVKVCAVDEDWSGLKLVYRLADR